MRNIKNFIRVILEGSWVLGFLIVIIFLGVSSMLGIIVEVTITDTKWEDDVVIKSLMLDTIIGAIILLVLMYLYSFRDKVLEWTKRD